MQTFVDKARNIFAEGEVYDMKNIICIILFAFLIIFLQTHNQILVILWLLVSILLVKLDNTLKSFIITVLFFGIGFSLYLFIINILLVEIEIKELSILLSRLSLIIILLPMLLFSLFSHTKFNNYWNKPKWNETIFFPFIWSGIHSTKVSTFLIIALTTNILIFIPLIILKGGAFFQDIWLVALVFSLTNAFFEEIIWRGTLLTRFSEQLGEKYAVIATSIGFGLQHYSLGFSWILCIVFSFGGFYYGGISVKSKSIFLSIIWHLILNLLMVFSGLILT